MVASLVLLGTLAASAQELGQAQAQARQLVQARLERYKELERLRKDLRYIAEELDREVLEEDAPKALSEYAAGGRQRLLGLKQRGFIDPRLKPVLSRLAALYKGLAARKDVRAYAGSLLKAVDEELRWAAATGRNEEEVLSLLDRRLVLSTGGLFPEDLTVKQWLEIDPIRAFMVKHRPTRPKSYAKATPEAIIAGSLHVQVGAELVGTVSHVYDCWFDQDYCFNIGDLHIELPPDWAVLHPEVPKPKDGQKVRLRGWTYFDSFHESEAEYDPESPILGKKRPTLWEIHPLQEVEILQ